MRIVVIGVVALLLAGCVSVEPVPGPEFDSETEAPGDEGQVTSELHHYRVLVDGPAGGGQTIITSIERADSSSEVVRHFYSMSQGWPFEFEFYAGAMYPTVRISANGRDGSCQIWRDGELVGWNRPTSDAYTVCSYRD